MSTKIVINVPELLPSVKHATIFEAFDSVDNGDSVIIHNDHDPKPVFYQLLGLRGNCFSWTYLKNGPDIWEIEIKKDERSKNDETIGQIVAGDIRKAEVFKKLGIDFCCGGKKSLAKVCREKGLDENEVRKNLNQIDTQKTAKTDFDKWKSSFLADYIVNVHHSYVKENSPLLNELIAKIVGKHLEKYPWMEEVQNKLHSLLSELDTHMKKEENVLFPYVKMLESANGYINGGFQTIQDPIWVMEADHEAAGDLMQQLNKLLNGYIAPDDACNTHQLFLYKLQEFENDLFQHVHLENNVLFPKALEMEQN